MKKEKKAEYLKTCQTELINEIIIKFPPEMRLKFTNNLKERFPNGPPPTGIPVN